MTSFSAAPKDYLFESFFAQAELTMRDYLNSRVADHNSLFVISLNSQTNTCVVVAHTDLHDPLRKFLLSQKGENQ